MKKGVIRGVIIGVFIIVAIVAIALFSQQNSEEYNSQDIEAAEDSITGLATSSSYVLYNLRVGEGIVHNNKQVQLINVINSKDVLISVDGVQGTIASGSKKLINGLEIKNNFVYPIYTINFETPDTWSVWLNVREPSKKRLVTAGCKVELVYNFNLLTDLGVSGYDDVNAYYITPVSTNSKIKVAKVKDQQKTEISTKEVWIYDLGSDSYLCGSDIEDCNRYQGGIVYRDIKYGDEKFFESLYYDGELYINC